MGVSFVVKCGCCCKFILRDVWRMIVLCLGVAILKSIVVAVKNKLKSVDASNIDFI